jgi:hypothetical protein
MGFLSKLKKLFSGGGSPSNLMEITVRCDRCGELIHAQVNLHNDLSLQDDDTYYCRKGLVGGGETRCYQQVTVEYTFDANRNVIERRVQGGQFVDTEE